MSEYAYFELTLRRLRAIVLQSPGMALSDAVKNIRHHYQDNESAKTSLTRYLRDGRVEGLRLDKGHVFVQEIP